MIHHLAAKRLGNKLTGLYVLNHILNYFDGFYRMPSIGMDYMIFYFRPDNKFPDYFFGGFYRDLDNPKGCSMDCFAYITHSPPNIPADLPSDWSFHECTHEDLDHLKQCYDHLSGGLLFEAFCLDRKGSREEKSIEHLYHSCGLKRKCGSFVLKYHNTAKAFFIIDESDKGINLSELLNSVKIIVTDAKDLPWDVLQAVLDRLTHMYGNESYPVLIYPSTYGESQGLVHEKKYNLWILNARYSDQYTEKLKQKAKISRIRMLLKYLMDKFRWASQ
jgi:hypothetical protein